MKTLLTLFTAFQFTILFAQPSNWMWTYTSTGNGESYGSTITVDQWGNAIVVGYYTDTIVFGGDTLIGNGTETQFVSKMNKYGHPSWIINSPALSSGFVGGGATCDSNGDIYVSNENNIAKIDSSGQIIWQHTAQNAFEIVSLDVDSSDNVFFTGFFRDSVEYDSITVFGEPGHEWDNHMFTCKIDYQTGAPIWIRTALLGDIVIGRPASVNVSEQGDVYVLGTILMDSDFGNGVTYTHNSFFESIFVCRYNQAGDCQWVVASGGNGIAQASDMIIEDNDYAYITGMYVQEAIFGNDTIANAPGSSDIGNVFVSKLDSSGNFIWSEGFASTGEGYDHGTRISRDDKRNIYLMGIFEDSIIWNNDTVIADPLATSVFVSSNVFVAKLDSSGAPQWATYGGPIGQPDFGDIYVYDDDDFFLVGYSITDSSFNRANDFYAFYGRWSDELDPTNVLDYMDEDEVLIYPNPANDVLFIDGINNTNNYNYTIVSITGATISQGNCSTRNSIAIGNLSSGLYYIRLYNSKSENSVVKPFVVG